MTFAGESVGAKELAGIINSDEFKKSRAAVLDVREYDEFAEGRVPGAIHIPLGELQGRVAELKKYKKLFVICYSGARSSSACRLLSKIAPDVAAVNVSGGMSAWYSAGLGIEK